MTDAILHILLGLALLYGGGEALVRGSAALASRLGMSPLIAGLTVVAFGTSMPELFSSVQASLAGKGNIAVGNAIGANIFNVGVVLGITAILRPLFGGMQLLRFEVPLMLGVVLLPVWVLWDRTVTPIEGGILVGLLLVYTLLAISTAKRPRTVEANAQQFDATIPTGRGSVGLDIVLIAGAIAMLVFGSQWMVKGASSIARYFTVSEAVIGLTIVAAGSSLPELSSCLVAAFRKQHGVALGNVIGSNIFNVLGVLGACGIAGGGAAPGVAMMDVVVMIIFSAALLTMLRSGTSLDRWEGVSLLAAYAVYVWWHWPK